MQQQRVALISGANRGIGEAIARQLAGNGWCVSLGMRTPASAAWHAIDTVQVVAYDATDAAAEARWVAAALERFGRIDAVVANAGLMIRKSVIEADEADMDALLEVNVKAPRRLAAAAWNALSASGRGRLIIMASLSGKRVKSAGSSLYSVSKFAALGLAHGLRHSGWDLGIRATAICPGFVATDMARALSTREDSQMTAPADLALLINTLLDLPNEASVAELNINCQLDDSY
ncbi:SDR family NAD(P)-dependent oxidoreductase [Pseudomonas typographi]|uniref:SDR family NAD(P)-dependent oxidoreductase n=1 Tax=Pseudomonas typographi TaxID=2715964 RepID=UPI00168356FE|nr:SDR family NAD(P)-dependent oxidoreductase [Pseudomonas typographi]MBD1554575.1 SDR family NAD(P)-dependent oxidoreductase [Pseudomonas typographi]MBD1588639.1 SDR family NAD(P)-dependent oxidoreductase [Pseudomonas typographi]